MAYVRANQSIDRGCALFRDFHRFDPDRIVRAVVRRRMPRVLVRLGRLKAVIYSSDKARPGKPLTYIHFMDTPPTLACDTAGRQLYVVGGNYRVTERGIEG